MRVDLNEFYKCAFWGLIGVIVGFLIAVFFNTKKEYEGSDTVVQTKVLEKDSLVQEISDSLLMEELVSQGIKHPKIVLAQARLETGNYTSEIFLTKNNLFGLYDSSKKEYYSFDSWRESVTAYKNKVQYKYKKGDYYKFLKDLGYAEDPEYINKVKTIAEV